MSGRILKTRLCDMLGIKYPIISAGMGPTLIGEKSGAPVELVVAVSEAGGMGVLGGSGMNVEELRDAIREIRKLTDKPFGVDLLLPQSLADTSQAGSATEMPLSVIISTLPDKYQDWIKKIRKELDLPEVEIMVKLNTTTMKPKEAVRVCLDEKIPLFCAGLGNPGWMVKDAHAVGTKVLGITGNTKNAKRMAQSGIDLLVAQGHEGGGHTGRIGTMVLLPAAIDAAKPVPVLAAGGIDSTDEDTKVSTAYTGKTLRASYNKFHDLWAESGLDPLPFPMQTLISSHLLAAFIEAKKNDYVGGLAGQVSGIIHEIKPAKQVLEDMVEEAVDILTRRLPQNVEAR